MADFPTLVEGQDSAQYEVESEDPTIRTEMEGGYVLSRARHTRIPRKTYKTGFTHIGTADKALLDTFYDVTVKGGSSVFNWTDPVTLNVIIVRFVGKLTFKYVGAGTNKRWNVAITLEQA